MNINQIKNSLMFKANKFPLEPRDMTVFSMINSDSQVSPEYDLIDFYLITHAFNEFDRRYGGNTRLNPAQERLVKEMLDTLNNVFNRMFTYVMLISVGETRHGHTTGKSDDIIAEFGEDIWNMALIIDGKNRSGARHEFLQSDRDLLRYMRYCDWNFLNCFVGGSFGGKKWEVISSKCTQVLSGEISPYVMVDMSWSMVHNTGSIFNKNTIYTMPSSWKGMLQMLDMQRAGAIPALITHFSKYDTDSQFSVSYNSMHQQHKDLLSNIITILELDGLDNYVPPEDIGNAGALDGYFKSQKSKVKSKGATTGESSFVSSGSVMDSGLDSLTILERA